MVDNSPSKITISDVALAANVSVMTVSRVLNGKDGVSESTRQRILKTIADLGYVANPAARILRSNSKIIGLIIPSITNSYIGEVLSGIAQAAERLNYGIMLYTQSGPNNVERSKYYATNLSNGLTDGVLMVVPFDYELLTEAFRSHDIPYILVDHHSDTVDEPAVLATNRKGIIDAMRHLLALGHQRIGFITGRMDMGCSGDRLQGYYDALKEVGLPEDPQLVREGDFEQQTGFNEAHVLLQLENPPTAIIASNDMMAFGVMDAIKDAGLRVGRDISVIGFDDIPMASQVYPALTTVRQPLAAMGEAGFELLVTLLEGKTPASWRRELATELVVRASTARAPVRSAAL